MNDIFHGFYIIDIFFHCFKCIYDTQTRKHLLSSFIQTYAYTMYCNLFVTFFFIYFSQKISFGENIWRDKKMPLFANVGQGC